MKKIYFLIICLVFLLLNASCKNSVSTSEELRKAEKPTSVNTTDEVYLQNNLSKDEYIENIAIVDERLNIIVIDKVFQKSNLDKKVQLLKPVLNQLKSENRILNYQFNLNLSKPNLNYYYNGGGGRIIMLEEFNKFEN